MEAGFQGDSGLGSGLIFYILKEVFFFFHLITFEHSFLPNSYWSSVGKILGNLILRKKKKSTERAFIFFLVLESPSGQESE